MNAKVNNWAVELEFQNINFEFIAGTKNILADTLSRLMRVSNSQKNNLATSFDTPPSRNYPQQE